jgi:hypothetical protein
VASTPANSAERLDPQDEIPAELSTVGTAIPAAPEPTDGSTDPDKTGSEASECPDAYTLASGQPTTTADRPPLSGPDGMLV